MMPVLSNFPKEEEKLKAKNKLKVLVFHSFRQNAQIMKGKTGKVDELIFEKKKGGMTKSS